MTEQQKQENENTSSNNGNKDVKASNGASTNTTTTISAVKTPNRGGGGRQAYKVSFGGAAGARSSSQQLATADDNKQLIPQKIGKANPIRDLFLFLIFIGFMFFLSLTSYKDVGRKIEEPDFKAASSVTPFTDMMNIRKFKSKMEKALKNNIESTTDGEAQAQAATLTSLTTSLEKRTLPCDLFLHASSIPSFTSIENLHSSTDWNFFVGDTQPLYQPGDEILNLGIPTLTIPNNMIMTMNNDNDDSNNYHYAIPPLALLLKHHPTLANVKPTQPLWTKRIFENNNDNNNNDNNLPMISLIATREILPGQELFLSYDDHPVSILTTSPTTTTTSTKTTTTTTASSSSTSSSSSSLSSSFLFFKYYKIPTLQDYLQADDMIQEARHVFQVTSYNPKSKNKVFQQKSGMVVAGLRMTQKAIARYDPTVAALLPIMADQLVQYKPKPTTASSHEYEQYYTSSTMFGALRNQTIPSLKASGVCISDYQYYQKNENNNENENQTSHGGRMQQAVLKGKRVMPMPLYVTTTTTTTSSMMMNENNKECLITNEGQYTNDNVDDSTTTTTTDCSSSSSTNLSSFGSTNNKCLYHSDSTLVLCPMIDLEYTTMTAFENESSLSLSELSNVPANAKFQWSPWNPVNATRKKPEAILEKYATSLTFDVIALKDLKPGEKIIVGLNRDAETGKFLVPDELFPEKWKGM